jgi:undecaprenyl-diphosphatase
MTFFEAIILGLVQGLAEFLPISSSGHLAVLQYIFGIKGDDVLLFAVLLHFGTLLSIFAVYFRDIWMLIKELGAVFQDLFAGKGLQPNKNDYRKLGLLIIMASIPTAFFGLLFRDAFSAMYGSLLIIGIGFILTGTLLFLAERIGKGLKGTREMTFLDGFLIGLFQSIAIAPGISRSGATIVGGLFTGLTRELAVRFAFLISIPSVLGALLIEAPDAFASGMSQTSLMPIIVGVVIAAVTGFVAIKTMIRVVSNKRLHYFSYYTWILGSAVIIYTLIN